MTKTERKEYDRKWRRRNRDKIAACQKRYREKHRDRLLAERRRRYAADPSRRNYNNAWNKKHSVRVAKRRLAWNHKNRGKLLFCFAKARAKRIGVKFTITHIDVVIPKRCPVFGVKLTTVIKKGDPNSPSIDRIIPKRGYVPGNVAVISLRANLLKNNASPAELTALAKWVKKAAC